MQMHINNLNKNTIIGLNRFFNHNLKINMLHNMIFIRFINSKIYRQRVKQKQKEKESLISVQHRLYNGSIL